VPPADLASSTALPGQNNREICYGTGVRIVLAFSLIGLVACSSDESPSFLLVDEGAYLRGEHVVRIDTSRVPSTTRADLFIDGLPVAISIVPPYDLLWDTRIVADGNHQLLVRAYVDGDDVQEAMQIEVDNTAPALGALPATATVGAQYAIPASDNLGILRVDVTSDVPDASPIAFTAPPYEMTWTLPCGATKLEVRVIDRAGAETTGSIEVAAHDVADQDCDGHAARADGGDDCNDADPHTNPTAFETLEGLDRNCDGTTGSLQTFDIDGDGVPGPAYGGDDCDDTDASVHGALPQLEATRVVVDGTPVIWGPGEAAIHEGGQHVTINRDGVVDRVAQAPDGRFTAWRVTTGANPRSVAVSNGRVAVGRATDVQIFEPVDVTWTEQTVIRGHDLVGRIGLAWHESGRYAAYQAGTTVWFAEYAGNAWRSTALVDAGAPLTGEIEISASPDHASVLFHTESAAWSASRSGATGPLAIRRFSRPGRIATVAAFANAVALVAVDGPRGGLLYDLANDTLVARVPARIVGLAIDGPYALVQPAGNDLQVFRIDDGFRRVLSIGTVGPIDTTSFGFIAGDGNLYDPGALAVPGADDVPGDGVDRDCDGNP
jgi:hypothetical protein